MKRKLIALLSLVLAMCIISACAEPSQAQPAETPAAESQPSAQPETQVPSDGQEEKPEETAPLKENETWNVFIYMVGSSLESGQGAASKDILEMKSLPLGGHVKVILETGGTKEWQTEGISSEKIGRYEVKNGEIKLLEEQEAASMGSAETLKDFVTWALGSHKADHNILIFWGHGMGPVTGVAYDEIYEDALTLPEIQDAFRSAGDGAFELIGFDACLMANLETANALKGKAGYLVASEESEPGGGWAYDKWLAYLLDNPGATGESLGKAICDSFYEACLSTGEASLATLSVLDMRQLDALNAAFDDFAARLDREAERNGRLSDIVRGVGKTETYGGQVSGDDFHNLFDLGDMAEKLNEVGGAAAEDLISVIDRAVVYHVKGENRSRSSGISVFYPYSFNDAASEGLDMYSDISPSENYTALLAYIAEQRELAAKNGSQIKLKSQIYVNNDGYYELLVDLDTIDLVDYALMNLYLPANKEETSFVWLGTDTQLTFDRDTGTVTDDFGGYWPMMDGELVSFHIYESTDEYSIYKIPILLNGERTTLWASYAYAGEESGHFKIMGAWDPGEEKSIAMIDEGDKITPVYYIIEGATGEITEQEGEEIIVRSGFALEDQPLPANMYYMNFQLEDTRGSGVQSYLLDITIDDDGYITAGEDSQASSQGADS